MTIPVPYSKEHTPHTLMYAAYLLQHLPHCYTKLEKLSVLLGYAILNELHHYVIHPCQKIFQENTGTRGTELFANIFFLKYPCRSSPQPQRVYKIFLLKRHELHDLHATMLHQLGIRHDAFSVKFQGLDAKLTGVEGAKVMEGILG